MRPGCSRALFCDVGFVMGQNETRANNVLGEIYRVSQNLCHKLFLGIPHPQLNKKIKQVLSMIVL